MIKKFKSIFINIDQFNDQFNNKLSQSEQTFIKNILGFFSASDGIVAENLDLNFDTDEKIEFM